MLPAKETATGSPGHLQTLSTSTVATGTRSEPLGVDLSGFQLLDMCSSEICSAISGTVVFYLASDGNLKPLGIYNFVYRYRTATVYRGEYTAALEPLSLLGELSTTYKLTISPRGTSTNKVILALVRINVKENGAYTVQLESGAIKCF